MREENKDNEGKGAAGSGGKVDGQKLDNQPYDLAVDVNDSEEIESDEEDDEVNAMGGSAAPGQEAQKKVPQKPANLPPQDQGTKPMVGEEKGGDDEEDDDEKEVPGTYNPSEYANL
jgi:hypothetical protein